MSKKYYSGIGSRNTPTPILDLMKNISTKLESEGFILRSGGAQGADSAFEEGVVDKANMEIYIPWKGFADKFSGDLGVILATELPNWEEAQDKVYDIHPAPERLSMGAIALHGRNMYQVLGKDLNTPSRFVVFWAPPTKDGVKGGTNSAYQLAKNNGIETFNLFEEEVQERFLRWVG